MSKVRNLNPYDMEARIHDLEENGGGGGGTTDGAKRSDIATDFSAETSYTAGNFVYYEGKLYIFNVDHAAGEWDATDVSPANVTDEVTSNKAAIDALDTEVDTLSARVDKHAYDGQYVEFESYTDVSNPYIAPADGYARVADGSLRMGTATHNVALVGGTGDTTGTVFVRKGTPLYVTTGTVHAYFIPLT